MSERSSSPRAKAARLVPVAILAAVVAWLFGLAPGEAQGEGTETLAARITDSLRQANLGDRVGVSVVDARTGREIVNVHGDLALNPASNMKIVTAAGALAATGALRIDLLLAVMAVAAVLGNVVNYAVGRRVAHRFFDEGHIPTRLHRFVKREYVRKAHDFFV